MLTIRVCVAARRSVSRSVPAKARYVRSTPNDRNKDREIVKKLFYLGNCGWDDKKRSDWLKSTPTDQVWLTQNFPPAELSFEEALVRHRQLLQPQMLNAPDAKVILNFHLDMAKSTKTVPPVNETLIPPHRLDDGTAKKLAIFTDDPDTIEFCQSVGIRDVGLSDLIVKFKKGVLKVADFDACFTTLSAVESLIPIRSVLKNKFPSVAQHTLGETIEELLAFWIDGVRCRSVEIDSTHAELCIPVGNLASTPLHQLQENAQFFYDHFAFKQSKKQTKKFIIKSFVTCPPSPESIFVSFDNPLS